MTYLNAVAFIIQSCGMTELDAPVSMFNRVAHIDAARVIYQYVA